MSGQCYSCGTEFGFLKKEHGCKNCGFAFCSKCLTHKATIPKERAEKIKLKDPKSSHHVCNKCYNILSGKVTPAEDAGSGRWSPPEAYKKRLAALEQKESPGASKGGHTKNGAGRPNPKYAGLDKPDQDIAQRLEKLKEKPKGEKVTDTDLVKRLAELKGENPAVKTGAIKPAATKPFYQPPDRRTQVEQIDDLLQEIADEVEIDSHQPDPATYVEDRLARLRQDPDPNTNKDGENNLDKGSAASPKTFVKNIDVGERTSKNGAGGGKSGEESDVDVAEVQALMARAATQMEQDAQKALAGMQKDKELMERLAEIQQRQKEKGAQKDKQGQDSNVDVAREDNEEEDSDEDEEVAARRIMQQFLEEVKLDEKVQNDITANMEASASCEASGASAKNKGKTDKMTKKPSAEPKSRKEDDDNDDYEDPDELPYCIICTEDAVIRCIDCDMDLYCQRCFRSQFE